MSLVREIRLRARNAVPQVLAASFVAYFAYHAMQGERGLNAWVHLTSELQTANILHQDLASQRQDLEKRVNLLRRESLDPDLLEERARVVLNLGHPDEYVIFLPPSLQ